MTLEESIVKLITYQISKQVMRKMIIENPEIVIIGFYKECRKNGMYLHTRFDYLEIPLMVRLEKQYENK